MPGHRWPEPVHANSGRPVREPPNLPAGPGCSSCSATATRYLHQARWPMPARPPPAAESRNQQLFVDGWPTGDAEFVPKDGCMGPDARTLSEASGERPAIVLIALDPTPWIHPRLRASCSHPQTPEEHLARLGDLLRAHREDLVIVASHSTPCAPVDRTAGFPTASQATCW